MNKQQPRKKPRTGLAITISIVVTALIVGGAGAFFYYSEKSENDDTEGILNSKIDEQEKELSTRSDTNKDDSQKSETTSDLKTFERSELGISFKYPPSFSISTDEERVDYGGGKTWHRVEFTQGNNERPFMRFETNPDGYGPLFFTKVYTIKEEKRGSLEIISAELVDSENAQEGIEFISSGIIEASNGNSYWWQFAFDEDDALESKFKEIIDSVVIVTGSSSESSNSSNETLENKSLSYKIQYPKDSYLTDNDESCVTIEYQNGYVKIADKSKVDSCLHSDSDPKTVKTEDVTIDGKNHTANGFEKKGGDDYLGNHHEWYVVTLPSGNRIEFGSARRSNTTFADYSKYREKIIEIVESYKSI